ncbi:MAG: hypothetical protein AAFU55_10040 [Pseudomonadota bacterium]
MTVNTDTRIAALIALAVLQLVMTAAMFAGSEPHPPLRVAPFAMGPWLAAAIATCGAAAWLSARGAGRFASGFAVLMALLSYGPQKYADPAFPLIWPAVIAAQVACIAIIADLAAPYLRKRARP